MKFDDLKVGIIVSGDYCLVIKIGIRSLVKFNMHLFFVYLVTILLLCYFCVGNGLVFRSLFVNNWIT